MKYPASYNHSSGIMKIYLSVFFALIFCISGIAFNKVKPSAAVPVISSETSEWSQIADSLQQSTIDHYSGKNGVFHENNKGKEKFHYWWNAHMVDVLVDGYLRTKDPSYLPKLKALVRGIKIANNDNYQIFFNDDMQWLGIACLRAYEATGDEEYKQVAEFLWNEVKKGWTDVHGGGIMWRTDTPEEKNACSNGPGALLALSLYHINQEQEYLDWAQKIFEWQMNTLVDPLTGLVWDNISNNKDGQAVINKDMVLSYNQGTHIGAATQLFNYTGDPQYLAEAWKTTRSLMTSPKITYEGILKNEGQGDGGLFKGILVRNLTLLAENPSLDSDKKKMLIDFLTYNANILRTFGLDRKQMLASADWTKKPTVETDLSTQLSALMLMEMAARLNLPKKEVDKYCRDKQVTTENISTPIKNEAVIVILGSSTAEGTGPIEKENAWVARFSKYLQKYAPGFKVINLARGGYTTLDILPGGDPEKNISKAMSLNPDAIIINLPSNDAAQGRGVDEQLKNYREIFDNIPKNIPVWVTTPQPRNFEKSKVQIQKDLVDATYAVIKEGFVIDLWTCFANEKGLLKPEYDSGDGVHMNDEAHLLIFNRVLQSRADLSRHLK